MGVCGCAGCYLLHFLKLGNFLSFAWLLDTYSLSMWVMYLETFYLVLMIQWVTLTQAAVRSGIPDASHAQVARVTLCNHDFRIAQETCRPQPSKYTRACVFWGTLEIHWDEPGVIWPGICLCLTSQTWLVWFGLCNIICLWNGAVDLFSNVFVFHQGNTSLNLETAFTCEFSVKTRESRQDNVKWNATKHNIC